jgi:RND family efflux transporter MFP subunit
MTPKRIAFAIALLLLAGIGYRLATHRSDPDPEAMGPGGLTQPPATVRVARVEQGEFAVRTEYVGSLRAKALAELYARTSGPLVEMTAQIGEPVRRGQVLARIDPAEATEVVTRQRAALRMAQATLAQRQAALEVAEATDARVGTLFDQQLVSPQDREAAQAARISAQAELEVARAGVAVAEANLSSAEVELEKTRIVAPFDGWVGQRFLDLGAFAAANRPVLSVVDLSTIKTTISLVQKDATRIAVGQPAAITTEAFPGHEFPGRVARISSVFDPQTNTVEAEVEVDNRGRELKPGMFATVSVAYRTEPTALLVPRAALLEDERETAVFVADRQAGEAAGAKARRVPVLRLGTSVGDDGRVAVEGDLGAGDEVVTLGQEILSDGESVVVAAGAAEAAVPAPAGGENLGD